MTNLTYKTVLRYLFEPGYWPTMAVLALAILGCVVLVAVIMSVLDIREGG